MCLIKPGCICSTAFTLAVVFTKFFFFFFLQPFIDCNLSYMVSIQLSFISEDLWLSILKSQSEYLLISELVVIAFVSLTKFYLTILKLQFLAAVNLINVNTLILSFRILCLGHIDVLSVVKPLWFSRCWTRRYTKLWRCTVHDTQELLKILFWAQLFREKYSSSPSPFLSLS